MILVGGVAFHYFAGFTGGRKLICPGLASARTVMGTHKLAFNCETLSRRDGVGTGKLAGNAVHEAFIEAVEKVGPRFAISTVVDESGACVDLFCGDWRTSHAAACDAYLGEHTVRIAEKRPLVIASCGGFPTTQYDPGPQIIEAASHACVEGGTIIS